MWAHNQGPYEFLSARHLKSPLFKVGCLEVFKKWRNNTFILSSNVTWPHDQRDMWLGKWEPLNLSPHPTKSGVSRSYGNADKTFLNLSRDIMGPHDPGLWLGRWESLTLSYHYAKSDAYGCCSSKDIKLLFCYVASHDHIIKRKCDLVSGSPLSLSHPCVKFDPYWS